jgi:hypothetical protein
MSLEHSPARQRRAAHSPREFAELHGLSVALLYKLWKQGLGPDRMKAGTRTLISDEAGARWRRERERATKQFKQAG